MADRSSANCTGSKDRIGDATVISGATPRIVQALRLLVGAAGFELATPCSQSRCSTRLSYAPIQGV